MNAAKLSRQINEGAALHQKGDLGNAERLYRDVLKSNPKQPDALHLLGVLVGQRGDNAKGIVLVRQALAVQSAFPDAHVNLARMLMATGELESARTHYERALTLKPNHAVAQNGLGFLYRALGASSEARAAFARAFRLEPRLMEAYINYCNVCRDAGDEAAIPAVATQGLAVDPQCAPLWLLRSEAAFTMGRLDDGWRDYEWRFRTSQNPVERPPYALPFWNGEDLSDKGILVWHEQSVGEDVLFSSMIPTLAAKARRCVVHTTDRLLPVFRRSFPNVEVYAGMVPADIVATLDVQSAAGSLGNG